MSGNDNTLPVSVAEVGESPAGGCEAGRSSSDCGEFGPGGAVEIVMGSDSDWPCVRPAFDILKEFGVVPHVFVISAHRTPGKMLAYGSSAAVRGVKIIIAAAGGAAHLPGMLASCTRLPVIGIPVPLGRLDGMDSLLSIVQMPAGVPVATVGVAAAQNAGLLALRILGTNDAEIAQRLERYADDLQSLVAHKNNRLQEDLWDEIGTS